MSRIIPLLMRLDALELRLDARRKAKAAEGQLDLFGDGSGNGQPCGRGWISRDKNCRIGEGDANDPRDTIAPFSAKTMEQIVSGIESRTFNPPAVRHNGTDLALSLQKLAEQNNEAGINARSAMAFMDEAGAIVMIQPKRRFGPVVQLNKPMPVWNADKSIEENLQQLNEWTTEQENGIGLLRNFAKRFNIWPEEMIEALESDKSPESQDFANSLRTALGQKGEMKWYKDARSHLQKMIKAAEGNLSDASLLRKVTEAYSAVVGASYVDGPAQVLGAAKHSLTMVLVPNDADGLYRGMGNIYWKASVAGQAGARLDPDAVNPAAMGASIRNTLDVRDKRIEFTFSNSVGLSDSERALTTHLHELGHMIHDYSSRTVEPGVAINGNQVIYPSNGTRIAPPAMERLIAAGTAAGPTSYSNTNVAELFAESFVAYVTAPDALRRYNRELHDWVDAMVTKARKNAVKAKGATAHIKNYAT
jgi:hypothetical protein